MCFEDYYGTLFVSDRIINYGGGKKTKTWVEPYEEHLNDSYRDTNMPWDNS
jgi:hypothetical protein